MDKNKDKGSDKPTTNKSITKKDKDPHPPKTPSFKKPSKTKVDIDLLKSDPSTANSPLSQFIKDLLRQENIEYYAYVEKYMHNFEKCFTHESMGTNNYEYYEIIGDSIINLAAITHIKLVYPELCNPESVKFIAKLKTKYVDKASLSTIAQKLGFEPFIKVAEEAKGKLRSIKEDTLEAFIGCLSEFVRDIYKQLCPDDDGRKKGDDDGRKKGDDDGKRDEKTRTSQSSSRITQQTTQLDKDSHFNQMGIIVASQFMTRLLQKHTEKIMDLSTIWDPKTILKEFFDAHKDYKCEYRREEGGDVGDQKDKDNKDITQKDNKDGKDKTKHDPMIKDSKNKIYHSVVYVTIDGITKKYGRGTDGNKNTSQMKAAQETIKMLKKEGLMIDKD